MSKRPSEHPHRRNRINEQFSVRLIRMLESPAYQALSVSAHRAISRIEIELAAHGGNDNGKLPVTYQNFIDYSMVRGSIAPALREAEALGFIECTKRGSGGNAEYREPSLYRLTFAHPRDSRQCPPSHEWQRIKTIEEAEQIARAARTNRNPVAVAKGRRANTFRNRCGKIDRSRYKNPHRNPKVFGTKTHTTGSVQKPTLLSRSWGRGKGPDTSDT